ncbi:leukotriene-B4 omega-hydroxylase 3-like [Mercenaria mercenaria]|uniref:leukotriene-B4 omega-hydroxylase 3-like n=1 Tax=Mercenaria mercenaria TaxID=6596 RepID=UPI00234F08F7|nr:leukotriene-B4 omega-hydroxylase 3-like [Mercenaria mercenaria]
MEVGLVNVFDKLTLVIQTGFVICGIYIIYKLVSYYNYVQRMKKCFKGAKGPEKCHWLFGSLVYFPEGEHAMHFVKLCNEYGSDQGYIVIWFPFMKPMVVACSPRIMGNICKSNEPKATGLTGVYRLLKPWLGEGLLIANGEKWARNRRLLTPAFHFEILKPYTTVFNQAADTIVKKIAAKAESGERFEAFQNVCLCTLEIILKCAFSYSKDIQNSGENNPYVNAVNRLTDSVRYRVVHPLTVFDFFWKLTPVGRQFKKDCDFVHSVAEEIIDKRKETLDKSGCETNRRYLDFLDILLTARDGTGRGLTKLEIRNEVDTFLFEGHDTTASAISWVLYSLAENTECQRKCQAEIDDVLEGRESDDLEWSDLAKLEYLTMCIKEGMRLHSPVPVVSRDTENEFDLGDRVAPKGTLIQLNIFALNHMENVWGSDHMEFKPERFSKENIDNIKHFQYVPFSAGPRNCIGQNFAMNEEKVVLSKLLRKFTFRLDPNHKAERFMSAVMRTKNGMYMFVEKREYLKK